MTGLIFLICPGGGFQWGIPGGHLLASEAGLHRSRFHLAGVVAAAGPPLLMVGGLCDCAALTFVHGEENRRPAEQVCATLLEGQERFELRLEFSELRRVDLVPLGGEQ